jgi:hypothetical protein
MVNETKRKYLYRATITVYVQASSYHEADAAVRDVVNKGVDSLPEGATFKVQYPISPIGHPVARTKAEGDA